MADQVRVIMVSVIVEEAILTFKKGKNRSADIEEKGIAICSCSKEWAKLGHSKAH